MKLDVGLLDDLELHQEQLNILKAAHTLSSHNKPLLLVTGSEDLTTPLKETEAIAKAAEGDYTECYIIPNTGHTFGAEHPFKGPTVALQLVSKAVTAFFSKSLVHSS